MKEKKNRDESVDIKLNGSAFGGLFQTIFVFECSAGHQTRCFSFFSVADFCDYINMNAHGILS